jgi:O-antigen/teichoic acid export membrane protein
MATFGYLFSVLGVYWSGIYGQYGFQLISLLIFIFTAQRLTKFRIHFLWEWKEAKRLIAVGFPLMLVAMAIVFSQTIDRVLILSIIGGARGLKLLGLLYISTLVVTFLMIASNSVSSVILPVFRTRIAQHKEAESLKDIIEGPMLLFTFAMAFFVPLTTIWTDVAVHTFLPAFMGGIAPMYILSWIGFIAIFEIFSGAIFSTLDKQWSLLAFQSTALALQVVGDYLVLKSGGGLIGIAIVTVSSRFVMGFSSFITSSTKSLRFKRAYEIAVLSLIPGVVAALATALGILYFPIGKKFLMNVSIGGIRSAIVLISWLPLLLLLKKRTGLFEAVKNVLLKIKEKSGRTF